MGGKGKEATQRILAIIVIMAMLLMMGIPPTVIIFFAVVVYFICRAVQRSEQQEIRCVFDFYIAANEILRDEERRWYGFEIADVIERGQGVLQMMSDPPPLVHFALGALYHRTADYDAAVEHLSYVLENEQGDEGHRFTYSAELGRYVKVLRRLEREPAEAPQTMAAIRSLDRARRTRAALLLEESRTQTRVQATTRAAVAAPAAKQVAAPNKEGAPLSPIASSSRQPALAPPPPMPPPIAEVLRDVYEEEKKTA